MKYLYIFLISMIPIVELRGAMPIAMAPGMDIPFYEALTICVLGNMVPVPFIYFFARKFLLWGCKQKHIGRFCTFFVEKGERAGQKLVRKTGRGGLFMALLIFVGIPIPGTGAWTGALVAALLDIRMRHALPAILLGLIIAGIIMGVVSLTGVHIFGL